ncbi:MAG: FAD-dependent oxidoreductase, partial [Marinoscillum sp.]
MIKHTGDVCIVGLGSGGIGAALACIDHGLKVIAIEREPSPGGNSVFNGVPDYPAGPGEMYNKWLYQTLHDSKGDRVIGMSVARDGIYSVGSSSLGYDQSLFRYAPVKNYSPANDFEDLKEISPTIIFRADDFSDHVKSSLKLKRNYIQISASATIKTKASEVVKFDEFQVESTTSTDQLPKDQQPTILYETTFEAVQDVENGTDGLKIRSVKCRHGSTEVLVEANIFIDCSANLVLAQALRKHPVCAKSSLPEMFMYINGDEVEYAKVKTGGSKWPGLNGTSQVYRVAYSTDVHRPAKKSNSLLGSFITGWDKQFYNITPLNMAIDGAEFFENQSDLEIYY